MTTNDDLIRRGDAKAACQKTADEAKAYHIPQMTLGAMSCRDAIAALPAATSDREARLVEALWATDEKITGALKPDRRLIEVLGEIAEAIIAARALLAELEAAK